jgi:hypothetical protein
VGTLLIFAGVTVALAGIARERRGLGKPVTDPAKALAMVRALRTAILGIAMAGAGAGWTWGVRPLVLVSLVVAAEELLETSVVAAALGAAVRRG